MHLLFVGPYGSVGSYQEDYPSTATLEPRKTYSLWDDRPMRRARVTVSGRVQGVFFRASAARRAEELRLSGWVRNGLRGEVEAAFEGPEDAVAEMIDWCRRGPTHARVDHVEVVDEAPSGEAGFRILDR